VERWFLSIRRGATALPGIRKKGGKVSLQVFRPEADLSFFLKGLPEGKLPTMIGDADILKSYGSNRANTAQKVSAAAAVVSAAAAVASMVAVSISLKLKPRQLLLGALDRQ